jgi:hypothetical protein
LIKLLVVTKETDLYAEQLHLQMIKSMDGIISLSADQKCSLSCQFVNVFPKVLGFDIEC